MTGQSARTRAANVPNPKGRGVDLSPAQVKACEENTAAMAALVAADERYTAALHAAFALDVPSADVARASGTDRSTVYKARKRFLAEQQPESG